MKYIANPVLVDAFKIMGTADNENGTMQLKLDDGQSVATTEGMTARMMPVAGDYYVVQSDGYIYLNPKEVFEKKYRLHESDGSIGAASEGFKYMNGTEAA